MVTTHIATVIHMGGDAYEITIRHASTPGVGVTIGIREFQEKVYPLAASVENGLFGRIRMRTGKLLFDKALLADNLNALLNGYAQGVVETEVRVEFADPRAEHQVRELFAAMPRELAERLLAALNEQYGIRRG